jgi:hypothetical protein
VADRKAKVLPMRKRKKGSPDVRLTYRQVVKTVR